MVTCHSSCQSIMPQINVFGGVDVNIYVGDDVVLLLIAVVVLGVVLRKLLKQLKRLIE